MNFSHVASQQPNVTDGTFFSGVYKDPTSAIMVTPVWKEEENGRKSFHNTVSCLCGQARLNPQNFPPSELFIQAWNNSSGISLRCTDAAFHWILAPLLSWSDLLDIQYSVWLPAGPEVVTHKKRSYLAGLLIMKNIDNKPKRLEKPPILYICR